MVGHPLSPSCADVAPTPTDADESKSNQPAGALLRAYHSIDFSTPVHRFVTVNVVGGFVRAVVGISESLSRCIAL